MRKTVQKILLDFDPLRKNILPALKKISADFGFVKKEDARLAAEYFSVPLSQIFAVASFYDLIKLEKSPEIVIQICSSASCASERSFELICEIEEALKIKAGDVFNSKIKLETVSCLGRCGEGPIVVVNGKIYEKVTKSDVHRILKEWL